MSDEAYAAATNAMGRAYFGGRWQSARLENATDRKAARAAVDAFLTFNPSAASPVASPAAGRVPSALGEAQAAPGAPPSSRDAG